MNEMRDEVREGQPYSCTNGNKTPSSSIVCSRICQTSQCTHQSTIVSALGLQSEQAKRENADGPLSDAREEGGSKEDV